MANLRQLSDGELDRLAGHASALAGMGWALPAELYAKLDTFLADLAAEQEDRAEQRGQTGRVPGARLPSEA
jgi:hypothetical protein